MFDEGNSTTNLNSCCGWKAGKSVINAPLIQNADGSFSPDTLGRAVRLGQQGARQEHLRRAEQSTERRRTGSSTTTPYSHFSFVRTLQDMFLLADPAKDGSYMARSKYTEKFIAQNIMNLPEYAGSADTHYDSVRPMNHKYVIPATYVEKATDDDIQPLQVGPDATQTNIWSVK